MGVEAILKTELINAEELPGYIETIRGQFNQSSGFTIKDLDDTQNFYGPRFLNLAGRLAGVRMELPKGYVEQDEIKVADEFKIAEHKASGAYYYYFPCVSDAAFAENERGKSFSGDVRTAMDYRLDLSDDPNRQPQTLNASSLADMLQAVSDPREIVFFTGAGLSDDGQDESVMSHTRFLAKHGIDKDCQLTPEYREFIRKFLTSAEYADQVFQEYGEFTESLWKPVPTAAHIALTAIVQHFDYSPLVVTNNYDIKQEAAGIIPVRKTALGWADELDYNYLDPIREERRLQLGNTMRELAKRAKLAVIIGQRADNNGYLKYLVERNPNITVAAINIDHNILDYLRSRDFVLTGDAQQVLSELQQLLVRQY